MSTETETIARILANGFNEHIRLHGPDGDQASETAELIGGGHGTVVTRKGVQYSVRVERFEVPESPAAPSLAERVTASLLGAGFRQYRNRMASNLAAFLVSEGVGVTVSLSWEGASEEWRGKVLATWASALRSAGFEVSERDGYLYVPEPGRDTTTAAGEDRQ